MQKEIDAIYKMNTFMENFINGQSFKQQGLFRGNFFQTNLLYLEVLKSNNTNCSLSLPTIHRMTSEKNTIDYTFSQIHKLIDDNFLLTLHNCTSNEKILPILLNTPSHSNMLIINNCINTVELFEPHGAFETSVNTKTNERRVDNIRKFVSELNEKNLDKNIYTFIPPVEVCPKGYKGFQYYEHKSLEYCKKIEIVNGIPIKNEKGYCSAWSIWYLDIRLKNPYIQPEKLLTFALEKSKSNWKSIRKMIVAYTKFSFTVLREILLSLDIPFSKFVNIFYSDDLSYLSSPTKEENEIYNSVISVLYKKFIEEL